jgi:hypothetical protein
MAWGNNMWLVIIDNNTYTSADGTNWTVGTSGPQGTAICVAFGNGTFIVSVSTNLYFTVDGISWTTPTNIQTFNVTAIHLIQYNGIMWIALNSGRPFVYFSMNGITWFYSSNADATVEDPAQNSAVTSAITTNGLDWLVGCMNTNSFTIFSKDGINWEYVVNIQGAGNSSSILNYETEDLTPYSGISYYRLKQTDFNGTYEYSSIVSINLSEEFDNVSVYPNPASSFINIFGRDIYLVNIINMKGVVFLTNVSSGLISINDLPNGIYILEIMGKDNKIIYKRLVINK